MRRGHPKFIGQRLREARIIRGFTQRVLGDKLGLSNRAISQYEKGQILPRAKILRKMCRVLRLPSDFFFWPSPEGPETPVFFRSMEQTTLSARTRIKYKLHWVSEIATYLSPYIESPLDGIFSSVAPENPCEIKRRDTESVAADLRMAWRLGQDPVPNVVEVLEQRGVIVVRIHLGTVSVDAFSNWRGTPQRPYIVLGDDKGAAARSRFDIAHELAHLVLHRHIQPKFMNNKDTFRLIEHQANRFAGAFLLPSKGFADDYQHPTIDSLAELKSKWNVSIGAMIKRIRHLDLISKDEEKRLWRTYKHRGYQQREPLDEQVVPENPVVLERTIRKLIEDGTKTRSAICKEIPLSPSEIEALSGLPPGYLRKKSTSRTFSR
jgi:Zn-dependent peptidase ImmA (M78 family)/transcriptional regulator with XRE-family HTH domain